MLEYSVAFEQLISRLKVSERTEQFPLLEANNRVLSQNLYAQLDNPLFSNSAMDGYAICDPDESLCQFQNIARITAGDASPSFVLEKGQAARIFTGAPIPKGTTAVVMQEKARIEKDSILIDQPVQLGLNIRKQAEEIKAGTLLFPKGHLLNPASIALLASQGIHQIPVFSPLKVTVFSTGNELLEPNQPLKSGKIYDANRYQLLTWLQSLMVELTDGGILPDDYAKSEQALLKASKTQDVILFSGGASVGEEDHIKALIQKCGTLINWKLAIKPGKPFGFGTVDHANIFMLPGNPVATFVTFFILVYPALLALQGQKAELKKVDAYANFERNKLEPRYEFLRGNLRYEQGKYIVDAFAQQESNMLGGLSLSNALIAIPSNTTITKGQTVMVYPFPF